jgi:hypothetical protein
MPYTALENSSPIRFVSHGIFHIEGVESTTAVASVDGCVHRDCLAVHFIQAELDGVMHAKKEVLSTNLVKKTTGIQALHNSNARVAEANLLSSRAVCFVHVLCNNKSATKLLGLPDFRATKQTKRFHHKTYQEYAKHSYQCATREPSPK